MTTTPKKPYNPDHAAQDIYDACALNSISRVEVSFDGQYGEGEIRDVYAYADTPSGHRYEFVNTHNIVTNSKRAAREYGTDDWYTVGEAPIDLYDAARQYVEYLLDQVDPSWYCDDGGFGTWTFETAANKATLEVWIRTSTLQHSESRKMIDM